MEARAEAAAQEGILNPAGTFISMPATHITNCELSSALSDSKGAKAAAWEEASGPTAPMHMAAAALTPVSVELRSFDVPASKGPALSFKDEKRLRTDCRTVASSSLRRSMMGSEYFTANSSNLEKYMTADVLTSLLESVNFLATSGAYALPSSPSNASAVMAPFTTDGNLSWRQSATSFTMLVSFILPRASTADARMLGFDSLRRAFTATACWAALGPIMPSAPMAKHRFFSCALVSIDATESA
mmetsp:Transcript_95279/g.193905  ORF Transcript_95279/g.193905 Transcript_95279/m.193905 type:complete len:244 (-) Transcript_95279:287-1018(-)